MKLNHWNRQTVNRTTRVEAHSSVAAQNNAGEGDREKTAKPCPDGSSARPGEFFSATLNRNTEKETRSIHMAYWFG
jgi:hypothetical protein